MDIPDFKSIAVNAGIRTFLKTTRCRLNGADDPKPAGWLLSGNRKAILKSWPDPQESLIRFERSHGIVDHLLDSGCRLSTGPIWLFRVGQDGIAREITGRIVRPGYEYIVVTGGSLPKPCPWMDGCTVDCAGVKKRFGLKYPTRFLPKICSGWRGLAFRWRGRSGCGPQVFPAVLGTAKAVVNG